MIPIITIDVMKRDEQNSGLCVGYMDNTLRDLGEQWVIHVELMLYGNTPL